MVFMFVYLTINLLSNVEIDQLQVNIRYLYHVKLKQRLPLYINTTMAQTGTLLQEIKHFLFGDFQIEPSFDFVHIQGASPGRWRRVRKLKHVLMWTFIGLLKTSFDATFCEFS